MKLTVHDSAVSSIGTSCLKYDSVVLNNNSLFKAEDIVSSGYTDVSTIISGIEGWDLYGYYTELPSEDIREEINILVLAQTFSASTETEKKVASKWFIVDKIDRDSVHTSQEQEDNANLLISGLIEAKKGIKILNNSLLIKDADLSNIEVIVNESIIFDIFVTGGTLNNSTLTLDRNDVLSAVTINLSSLLDDTDNFTTGTTLIGSTLYFDRTNGLSAYTTDLSSFLDDTNTFATGGTYNSSTDIITIGRNDDTTFNITGVENSFVTGATYSSDTLTISRTEGLNDIVIDLTGGTSTITGSFILASVITPPEITADVDDYNPSGLTTASWVRISSDGDKDIRGIDSTDIIHGTLIVFTNINPEKDDKIKFKNNDGNSLAANRFFFAGDVNVRGNESITLIYDGVISRWRLLSKN